MKTVLVVDDSPTMRKMVMATLGKRHRYLEAASGLEAIEKLALDRVDLIVLDLNMPDMHGFEFLRFLNKNRALAALPVIVLTTRDDERSRKEALALGAAKYFTKPFVPESLRAHADELLKGQ